MQFPFLSYADVRSSIKPLLIRNTTLGRCENSISELGISAFGSEIYVNGMENVEDSYFYSYDPVSIARL